MCLALCCVAVILVIAELQDVQSSILPKPTLKLNNQEVNVYSYQLDTKNLNCIVNDKFLSFSIDSSEVSRGFKNPSIRDKRLIRLLSHLSGGYLRVGGSTADRIIFNPGPGLWSNDYVPVESRLCAYENINCVNSTKVASVNTKPVYMSGSDWIELNEFCLTAGFKLLFDFDVLLRNDDNVWDSRNAELLLNFSSSHGYNVDWELGNEPNLFPGEFGVEVAPEKLAKDFVTLRSILDRFTLYKSSLLIGPSTTNPYLKAKVDSSLVYLKTFLAHGPNVSAVSWHFYYFKENAKLEDFLNPANYDHLNNCIEAVKGAVRDAGLLSTTPIWIGESNSASGGGATNLSDRFVGSLLHLHRLGTSAASGVSLVVRQSLYRGRYRLIDADEMFPLTDYWVSIIYKRLVGRKVLNISEVSGVASSNDTIPLRIYAHCSTTSSYPVIYGFNLNNQTLGITMNSNNNGDLYSLEGYPDILSKYVKLNGEVLQVGSNQELPQLRPITVDLRKPVPVRPYSIFFLVSYHKLAICGQ